MSARRTGIAGWLVLVTLAGACGTGRRQDTATVQRVISGDTTTVISTGPRFKTSVLQLEHELFIGDPNGDTGRNPIRLGPVAVSEEDMVYALDSEVARMGGRDRVLVYDDQGLFVRKWGRGGEGPTDLDGIVTLAVLPNGLLAAGGHSLMRIFTTSGRLVEAWRTFRAENTEGWVPPSNTTLILYLQQSETTLVRSMRSDAHQRRYETETVLVRKDGSLLRLLDRCIQTDAFVSHSSPSGSYSMFLPWLPEVVGCADQNGRVYWGRTDVLGFYRLDLATGSHLHAQVDVPPPELDQAEIDRLARYMARSSTGAVETGFYEWMRHLPFPAHRPYFEEIVVDSQGRVWLRDNLGGGMLAQHFLRREGLMVRYHLFDPEGAYLGVVDAPVKIIRITGSHLYSLEVEPEYGYQRIRRYRIIEELH